MNPFCLETDLCSGYTTANAKVLFPKIFPTLQEGRVRLMVFHSLCRCRFQIEANVQADNILRRE